MVFSLTKVLRLAQLRLRRQSLAVVGAEGFTITEEKLKRENMALA
ncbi:MAG: hypothetical protein WAL45_11755 [Terracidiphilus sp.]